MRKTARFTLALFLVVFGAAFIAACSSDAEDAVDDVQETADSLQDEAADEVGEAGARAAAEAYRAALKADDGGDEAGLRSVAVLEENVTDLPGDPEVVGIEDGDGDGLDDDGNVEFVVGDAIACVSVPETGDEVDVTDGAC